MTKDKIAKNLLEEKTCDKCNHYGDEYPSPLYCALSEAKKRLPPENTCEKWEKNPFLTPLIPKLMLPLVRHTFPSLIASQIVSVQPIEAKGIYYLKYIKHSKFVAWIIRKLDQFFPGRPRITRIFRSVYERVKRWLKTMWKHTSVALLLGLRLLRRMF
jgi:hypothetical protein